MRGVAAAIALLLVGCATQEAMLWLRTDGQRIPESPALLEQARVDTTICEGEAAKLNNAGDDVSARRRLGNVGAVMRGCMAGRGYVLVPASEAETRRGEMAAAKQAR